MQEENLFTLRNTHLSSNLPDSLKVRRDLLSLVVALQSREKTCFRQQLEPVADADDQLSVAHEPQKLVYEIARRILYPLVFPLHGLRLSGAEVVAVEKTAGEIEEVVVVDILGPLHQRADMDDLHVESGEAVCVGRLTLAIDAVPRENEAFGCLFSMLRHSCEVRQG